jgi:addiction module RelB/DinJ family antitoxin
MAKTSSLYIRIDPEVKADVERIYSRFGMSITDAVNVFLYQSRNVGGLPFPLNAPEKTASVTGLQGCGVLQKYADPSKIPNEKDAWKTAAVKKYGDT